MHPDTPPPSETDSLPPNGLPDPGDAPEPETAPPQEEPAKPISLDQLHEELMATATESRRNARRSFDALKGFGTVLDAMSATLNDLHQTVRNSIGTPAKPPAADPNRDIDLGLIELADRLARIQSALDREPADATSFWPGARQRLEAWRDDRRQLAAAFSILKTHIEGLLTRRGLEPLRALGKPFDPNTMNAVEATADAAQPDRIVLEDLLPGWRYAATGDILRPVHVRVCRH